jgi:hypothetical protein
VLRVDVLGLVLVAERCGEAVRLLEGVRVGENLLTGVWLGRDIVLVRDRVVGAERCAEDLDAV